MDEPFINYSNYLNCFIDLKFLAIIIENQDVTRRA
jgi:hypothetical protein